MWAWYVGQLARRPLVTKAVTSGSISATGDLICQLLQRGDEPWRWDARRTLVLGGYALLVSGPLLHYWFGWLERVVRSPGWSAGRTALARVAVDQLLYAPVHVGLFFGAMHVVNGRTAEETEAAYWRTIKTMYFVWPAAQLFNFNYVRPELRLAFSNCVGLFWWVFMSYMSARGSRVTVNDDDHVTI